VTPKKETTEKRRQVAPK